MMGRRARKRKQPPPLPLRLNKEKYPTAPATLARDSAGLWRFDDKAYNCTTPAPGRETGWGVVGAVHPGKLVHVTDSSSGASFLVDTCLHTASVLILLIYCLLVPSLDQLTVNVSCAGVNGG